MSRHMPSSHLTTDPLLALYEQVPTFQCKPGCHDCCGPVPWLNVELRKARAVSSECIETMSVNGSTVTVGANMNCPFLNVDEHDGCGCTVYEQRPLICRLYGTITNNKMVCPHGCRPTIRLSDTEQDEIMEEYFRLKAAGA